MLDQRASQSHERRTTPVMPGFALAIPAFFAEHRRGGRQGLEQGDAPLAFWSFWPQNGTGKLGGGRATRQPGQVRKEAALTRSGSGRSSVSYLIFGSESRE